MRALPRKWLNELSMGLALVGAVSCAQSTGDGSNTVEHGSYDSGGVQEAGADTSGSQADATANDAPLALELCSVRFPSCGDEYILYSYSQCPLAVPELGTSCAYKYTNCFYCRGTSATVENGGNGALDAVRSCGVSGPWSFTDFSCVY